MASITKRGEFQYQAIVRRTGYKAQTKTFETKREAEQWAIIVESEMLQNSFVDTRVAAKITLAEMLKRYQEEVTVTKKSAKSESLTIRHWLAHPLSLRPLGSLTSHDFSKFSSERLKSVSPATVRIELAVISNMFTVMKKTWGMPLKNPILDMAKPQLNLEGRKRRLKGDEEKRLLAAALDAKVRTPNLWLAIVLAIETGMRAGEILSLEWEDIDLHGRVIKLTETKNGAPRTVPLSWDARQALLYKTISSDGLSKVMDFHDSNGLSASFRRACNRAGIEGLRFHDLRHEAASRMAQGMEVHTLAKAMGWKTLQMAMRYNNPTDEELVTAVDDSKRVLLQRKRQLSSESANNRN